MLFLVRTSYHIHMSDNLPNVRTVIHDIGKVEKYDSKMYRWKLRRT